MGRKLKAFCIALPAGGNRRNQQWIGRSAKSAHNHVENSPQSIQLVELSAKAVCKVMS